MILGQNLFKKIFIELPKGKINNIFKNSDLIIAINSRILAAQLVQPNSAETVNQDERRKDLIRVQRKEVLAKEISKLEQIIKYLQEARIDQQQKDLLVTVKNEILRISKSLTLDSLDQTEQDLNKSQIGLKQLIPAMLLTLKTIQGKTLTSLGVSFNKMKEDFGKIPQAVYEDNKFNKDALAVQKSIKVSIAEIEKYFLKIQKPNMDEVFNYPPSLENTMDWIEQISTALGILEAEINKLQKIATNYTQATTKKTTQETKQASPISQAVFRQFIARAKEIRATDVQVKIVQEQIGLIIEEWERLANRSLTLDGIKDQLDAILKRSTFIMDSKLKSRLKLAFHPDKYQATQELNALANTICSLID